MRRPCQMMPAYGMPQGWTPPPDHTVPLPAAPRPARATALPESFHSRRPCRALPTITPELVAAYAR